MMDRKFRKRTQLESRSCSSKRSNGYRKHYRSDRQHNKDRHPTKQSCSNNNTEGRSYRDHGSRNNDKSNSRKHEANFNCKRLESDRRYRETFASSVNENYNRHRNDSRNLSTHRSRDSRKRRLDARDRSSPKTSKRRRDYLSSREREPVKRFRKRSRSKERVRKYQHRRSRSRGINYRQHRRDSSSSRDPNYRQHRRSSSNDSYQNKRNKSRNQSAARNRDSSRSRHDSRSHHEKEIEPKRRLYLGGVPPHVTEDEIDRLFKIKPIKIKIIRAKNGNCKGFCFVSFKRWEDAGMGLHLIDERNKTLQYKKGQNDKVCDVKLNVMYAGKESDED